MSYLTESVHEIERKKGAGFYHIQETNVVSLTTCLDAEEYVERVYADKCGYTGPTHVVSSKVEDGYHVMVMEE